MKSHAWRWPVLLWAIGLLMAFHPMILSGFQQMQTDPGDTRLNHYVLEHGYRWLIGDPNHSEFWNPPFFYPKTNVAAYTDVLIGVAPFYGIWRVLGFHPDTSFQIWMLMIVSLNFLTAYLWLRRGLRPLIHLDSLPAAAGAFIFAFASARIAQMGHQQLLPQFYSMIALYALTRLFTEGGRTWIAVFFSAVTLQLYAGFYLGWFLAVGIEVAILWAVVFPTPRRQVIHLVRSHWKTVSASALASAVVLAPMVFHYLEAGKEVGYRRFEQETIWMVPRLQSWLYLGPGSWLYSWQDRFELFRNLPVKHEHQIGLGFLTSVIAGIGLFSDRKNRWIPFFAVCSLTVFLAVTLFPWNFTAWRYLHPVIPAAGAIRALSRIGLLLLIPAALGIAIFLQKRTRAGWFAAGLVLFCAAEQGQTTAHYDKLKTRAQIEAIVHKIDPTCQAFYLSPVLEPGQGTPEWKFQVDAMWAQMLSGVPTVNGYSGNFPPGWWGLFYNRIGKPDDEPRLRQELNRWALAKQLDPGKVCWVRMPVGD